ncbi:MAG: hypothetical protein IKC13_05030 [Elusimicrobiaceae bacterium]|nr:hypothetical protein [Elusimicrobiaceae bacterium]
MKENHLTQLAILEAKSAAQMYGRDCRVVRWAFAYRRLRNKIWWQWRRKMMSCFLSAPQKDDCLHVLWHLRGGMGDVAAARLAVLAMRERLPDAVFYYYTDSPAAASAVFEENGQNIFLPSQEPAFYKYDLSFELCQSFRLMHANEKRLAALQADLLPLLEEMKNRQKLFSFFLDDSYLMEDLLGRYMYRQGLTRLDLQSYLSGLDFDTQATPALPVELTDENKLEKFGLKGKPYLTIHDGIDATFRLGGQRALKCWSVEKWKELVRQIKAQYPHIVVVQLGGKNSQKFDFADVSLVGQTALADLPALLQHSLLHIDGESGLVQLGRYLKTICIVLFGPTDKAYFSLAKNINLKAEKCGSCMWLLGPKWHTECRLGYGVCQNMQAISVAQVLDAVKAQLK